MRAKYLIYQLAHNVIFSLDTHMRKAPFLESTRENMTTKLLVCTYIAAVTMATTTQKPGNYGDVTRTLNAMQEELNALKDERKHDREEIDQLKVKNEALEKKLDAHENKLTSLTGKADVDTLFLATISSQFVDIAFEEVIEWDSAPINSGGHFSTVTGAYTAPYDGYYQFSVSKRSDQFRADFWLLVDQDRYLFSDLYAEGSATQMSSMTINVQLTAGQIIRVENAYSSAIYGTDPNGFIYSWFTGYLLYGL